MIELTTQRGEKFYLNASLIERIIERQGNTSEIFLTTGQTATCIESPDKVAKMFNKATAWQRWQAE